MANTVSVEILLEVKAAQDAISDLQKQVEKMSNNAAKSIDKIDVAIGALAASLAKDIFNSAIKGAKELFNFLVTDGIKAAQEQEEAINRLNIALQATGKHTDSTSADLLNFASAMQTATRYSDELITENMALLQSIADLSGEGLKEATKAALDLASAMQIDLRTATMAVAKAAEGNVDALKRYGVEVVKGANDTETFANALDALNSKFGGAASGAVKTFGGQLAQMQNSLNEVQETFGAMIIQNPAVISAIGVLNKGFIELQKVFEENKTKIEPFITLIGVTFVDYAKLFFEATALMVKGLANLAEFVTNNQWVFDLLNSTIIKTIPGLQTFMLLMNTFKGDAPKEEVKKVSDQMLYLQENADKAKASFENLFTDIPTAPPAVSPLLPPDQLKQVLANEQTEIDKHNAELLAKQKTFEDSLKAVKDQYALAAAQEKVVQAELEKAMLDENAIAEQEFLKAQLDALALIKLDAQIKELTARGLHLEALKKMEEKARLEDTIAKKKKAKTDEEIEKQKMDDRAFVINAIASMQNSSNKSMAAVGKAFAIYQTTLSTYEGIGKALGAFPPPYNFAMAALVGAAGFANVARTAGLNFAQGGVVPGNAFTGDRVQANVNSGEMILNRRQQENLFEAIDSGGSSVGGTTINIQGNVIADDDYQIDTLIGRINTAIEFRNAKFVGVA